MIADSEDKVGRRRESRLARWTAIPSAARNLSDRPATGAEAWARTTAGVVALLIILQLLTGALLAFYYVPSTASAHATTEYVEKVVAGGSWVRALHFHGSQWLPLALLLHLFQLFLHRTYERKPVGWLAAVLLLALVLANGATGYSLPWDARAYFSTRVAAGIAGGLPFAGDSLRAWLLAGADVSTLTVSRFYALHVVVVPMLILAVAFARLFIFREPGRDRPETNIPHEEEFVASRAFRRRQLVRNSVSVAVVFLILAVVAWKIPAPLGPRAGTEASGYLPRPGAQFLWLFQLLKYFPPAAASLVALLLPTSLLGALAILPLLRDGRRGRPARLNPRRLGACAFAVTCLLVTGLTAAAYLEDARDPRVREQFARQAAEEKEFRQTPFTPRLSDVLRDQAKEEQTALTETAPAQAASSEQPPPVGFTNNCAKCHGARGEGRSVNPALVGLSARPNRTAEDIVAIMKNPRAYNLDKRMPSFAGKLSDEEMRSIAEWVAALK